MTVETDGSRALCAWLDERGLGSGKDLARWLGVHETLVSYWKSGNRRPSAFHRAALEAVCEIATDDWFTEREHRRLIGLSERYG